MTKHPDALVVGAGVVGLTSAIALAEAGLATRVLAAAPPEETTSFVAGAIWGPTRTSSSPRVHEWAQVGLEVLSELAADPRAAIRQVSGIEVAATAGAHSQWISILPSSRVLSAAELPDGFASGCRYTAPIASMPVYLGYLVERFKAAGGTLDIGAPVTSLRSLDAQLIVNCTGIGARDLVPDPAVVPLRGQVVIVANPGIEEFFRAPSDGTDSTYIFPHGDYVVLGGTSHSGAWDLAPRPAITQRILRDCAAADPRLRGVEVLAERVGLRPYRPDVRLEAEALDAGRVLWHNYGHGGAGITLAWGCARELASSVLSLRDVRPGPGWSPLRDVRPGRGGRLGRHGVAGRERVVDVPRT
ncbi:MAG: amino acid oxidase [Actinomycetia bacterium]|nr:amino acid oxidase [Actinomycetes bacterium]